MKNLTLRNITKACHGEYRGPENLLDKEVAGVTIDSRKVEKDYPVSYRHLSLPTILRV